MTLPVATSTVAMMLLFGTNAILFFTFLLVKKSLSSGKEHSEEKDSEDDSNGLVDSVGKKRMAVTVPTGSHDKELSKPFVGSLSCYNNLTTELFRLSLILLLTYVCEKHWMYDHSGKTYNRDLFMFVVLLFFVYGFYTIKPISDLKLLGRDQTEEWKGWMQFIFLLYHYFHAEEVYNSVRVMITCYVWMTGFGNFSFFYIKKDFGWLRLVQMMWRLNFSVLLLMWTHGNTWILYYICPMHTFYFLMVFTTMYCFSYLNYDKWGIRIKLLVLGIIIYFIWDYNSKIFDFIFGFMGTDSIIGAGSGSVYEYYFRTSLDHWSTYFGMIFCLNYNLAESFFKFAKGWPLLVTAVLMAIASIWWYNNIYVLEKLEYNLNHSYYAIIPLTSYIFFRNITPWIRGGVSMSMHTLGKTTLETYLLQHHIWLTSNAKTLLTIVPEHPWVNFCVATIVFFVCSKELYRLTMSLRGMILPEPEKKDNTTTVARNNIIGSILVVLFCFTLAYVIQHHMAAVGLFTVLTFCIGLSALALFVIGRNSTTGGKLSENFAIQNIYKSITFSLLCAFGVCFVLHTAIYGAGLTFEDQALKAAGPVTWASTRFNVTRSCLDAVSVGAWKHIECADHIYPSLDRVAFCDHDTWEWTVADDSCPITKIQNKRAMGAFKGKKVAFMGDSATRGVYHQFVKLLNPTYTDKSTVSLKHVDQHVDIAPDSSVTFHWAPFASNISDLVVKNGGDYDFIVMGVGVWDALHIRNLKDFTTSLEKVGESFEKSNRKNVVKLWINSPKIINGKLSSPDKQKYMTEEVVMAYRDSVRSSRAAKIFNNIIETGSVSDNQDFNSYDGIHYTADVYSVISQMVANSYILQFPNYFVKNAPKFPPKATGGMSNKALGFYVLCLAAVILFTMDNFLGFGFISMKIFGLNFDYKTVMDAFHKENKIIITSVADKEKAFDSSNDNNGSSEAQSGNAESDRLLTANV